MSLSAAHKSRIIYCVVEENGYQVCKTSNHLLILDISQVP